MTAVLYTKTGAPKRWVALTADRYDMLKEWILQGNYIIISSKRVSTIKVLDSAYKAVRYVEAITEIRG
jgi:hypothetical protein